MVDLYLADHSTGFSLTMMDEDGKHVTLSFPREKELARTPQQDNLRNQLSKLGNTPFEARKIDIDFEENWFIPSSVLAEWRRTVVERMIAVRKLTYQREVAVMKPTHHAYPVRSLSYLGNVMNAQAASFYRDHGVTTIAPALEKQEVPDSVLMFCKHCLRFSMGWCPSRQHGKSPYKEPYYLVSTDGRRFELSFDCKNCMMKVSAV